MTSRSETKASKIRAILAKNPNITAKQVAEMVGCKVQAVHSIRYLDKRKTRKSGVAVKSKRKVIRISKTQADLAKRLNVPVVDYAKHLANPQPLDQVQKNLARSLGMSTSEYASHVLAEKVSDLEHQIIGFRAVISYLENQLGLKNSQ